MDRNHRELKGSVRVMSLQKGNSKEKTGILHLSCQQNKWFIGVRFCFQVQDQFTWPLKGNVKRIILKKHLRLELGSGGEVIRMINFQAGNPLKFKELIECMHLDKMPMENDTLSTDVENRPQFANFPTRGTMPGSTRIPLSPKQPHASKPQENNKNSCINSISNSSRDNKHFLERSQMKSAEKLSNITTGNFYSKTPATQRTYGAVAINTLPRMKRPGLMPDPEKRESLKRPRSDVKYDWNKRYTTPTKTELQGFSNLGNTCYMNAILQSLFHLPTFADDLVTLFRKVRKHHRQFDSSQLYVHLATLLQVHKSDGSQEKKRRCLTQIKNAISASAKRFSGYGQHDAHEFMSQVLDQLKEETITLNNAKVHEPKDGEVMDKRTATPERREQSQDESLRANYDNPTINNFEFAVLHTIQCLECGDEVHKEETFHDLSLDIPRKWMCPGERTIQDALDLFFKDERIEYKCEECGKTNVHVGHKFTRLPRILIMHLKRYSILQQGTLCVKSGGMTSIPRYITLQSHCTERTSPPFPPDLNSSIENETLDAENIIDSSSMGDNDTPSRRKLDFKDSFKPVKMHVRDDAAMVLAKGLRHDMETNHAHKTEAIFPDHLDDANSVSEDSVSLLAVDEELPMLSDADDGSSLPIFTLNEKYKHQRPILTQVDGTSDPRSPATNHESLDEEELKQMTEEEAYQYALQKSLLDVTTSLLPHSVMQETNAIPMDIAGEQRLPASPEIKYDSCDIGVTGTHKGGLDVSHVGCGRCENRELKSASNNCDNDKNKSLSGANDDSHALSNLKKENTAIYPVFENKLPSRNRFSKQHSTPHSKQHSTPKREVAPRRSIKNNCIAELIAQDVFGEDVGEDFKLEFEKDMVEEVPESVTKKRVPLQTTESHKGILNEHVGGTADVSTNTKDEDKENVTPPSPVQGDPPRSAGKKGMDWLEKRQEDQQKEEQQLQHALEMSLREQDDTEQREKDEIRRATELSLQELNPGYNISYDSDEEPPPDPSLLRQNVVYPEDALRRLQSNARTGELPYSYRLVSVVSHLGSSSNVGHYVSDALNIRKNQWFSYDDTHVTKTSELDVCMSRQQTGYVFFYCAKELLEELEELYRHGLDVRTIS